MNTKQKYVSFGVLVAIVLQMLFFTPLLLTSAKGLKHKHGSLFDVGGVWGVDVPAFILYLGLILIFGGIAFYLAKDTMKKK